ncbi:hypothetical protein MMC14_006683 [Varicellaria rhodocarpa]|nr:hypothetical protein [Varicellaria rhodocarpa]
MEVSSFNIDFAKYKLSNERPRYCYDTNGIYYADGEIKLFEKSIKEWNESSGATTRAQNAFDKIKYRFQILLFSKGMNMLGNVPFQKAFVEWMTVPAQRELFRSRFVWPMRSKIALGGDLRVFRQEIEGEIEKTRTGKAETKLSTAIENVVCHVH